MKFNIITLGCKVNTYESEAIKEMFIKENYLYVEDLKEADIVIVNTCSVTNIADNKSKKIIRKARRENEQCILVVCGCSSQNKQSDYESMPIDILLGNRKKSEIVSLVKEYQKKQERYKYFTNERDLDFESMNVLKFTSQTRAFIKIQDGCNNFCSYCIIPYVRGDIRSKNFDSILKEAKCLADNGHQEIVLTGIHTGSYNFDGKDLVDLIYELENIDNIKRIRLSSIEITELNEKFMTLLKTSKKLCNHLHIPLQSGSDNILKRMNRKYNKAYFQDKIEKIRNIRNDISITTDVIVGHPYETEEDYKECFLFCENMNFSKIHVFPYSIRSGTASANMPNQVPENIKKERAKKLIELSNKLETKYYNSFVGKKVLILTEEKIDKKTIGHTSNYLKVLVEENINPNTFYDVKIYTIKNNIAIGKIVK